MPWSTSTRAARLPTDWTQRRLAVQQRAGGRCEAHTHHPACNGIGAECDHIINGDNHDPTNLQWLSTPCHRAKTQREAARARPSARRTPEQHPGRL